MQQLNAFAADYAGDIGFYVVSFDEDAEVVANYIAEHRYRGFVAAQPVGTMLADLAVTRQSAMIALNARGRILHRQTKGNAGEWPAYLNQLAENPNAAPAPRDAQQQREQRRQDLQLPS